MVVHVHCIEISEGIDGSTIDLISRRFWGPTAATAQHDAHYAIESAR